ncbi:MAG TPA: translocation/assembly module TamB domain-containing protein, partial [Polyangiaceae bacterium]|nr:translocation/assembly module TamB domain-containing protein [Polyangiaceae bacterium]
MAHLLRLLGFCGSALAVLVLFTSSLVAGVVVHLDTPTARRVAARQIGRILDASFRGHGCVERIGKLGLFGLAQTDVTMDDPQGRRVLTVRGAHVRIATIGPATALMAGGPFTLRLAEVVIDDADVRLDADREGRLYLFDAFAPRGRAAPVGPSVGGIELVISRAAVRHVRAHRLGADGRPHDADARDVRGAFSYRPDVVEGVVFDATITAHGLIGGADVGGNLNGRTTIPLAPGASVAGRLTWNGQIGGVAHSIRAVFARNEVDAVFDVPHIRPRDVRLLWPGSAIEEPSSLHLEAHGTLPEIDATLHARLGGAALDARAKLLAGEDRRMGLSITAHDVDVRQFAACLPRSQLELVANASAHSRADGSLEADLLISLVGGRVGQSEAPRAGLRARGRFDPSRKTVDATVSADVSDVAGGGVRVDRAVVAARTLGSIAAPRIDMAIHARGMEAGGRRLHTVDLTARGIAPLFHVEASARGPDVPDVDAAADLDIEKPIALHEMRVSLTRASEHALLTAQSVAFEPENLGVTDARLEGLGAPLTANLSLSGRELRLEASAPGLDLGRIARLAHVENEVHEGTVSIEADVDARRNRGTGACTISLANASIYGVRGVEARAHFELENRRLAGMLHAAAEGVGTLDVDAPRIELPGFASLADGAWRQASGSLEIAARGDIARIATLLPARWIPLSEARGVVALHALVGGDARDAAHDVTLSLTTDHLALAPLASRARSVDGVPVVAPLPPWRLDGIDFAVEGSLGGRSGAIDAWIRARDAHGDLARLHVVSNGFPSEDPFTDPRRLEADLRNTPFELYLEVPERDLDTLPTVLKPNCISGRFRAVVAAKGTVLAPDLQLTATLARAGLASHSSHGESSNLPLDVRIVARYDGRKATASVEATSGQARTLEATTEFRAPVDQLLETGGAPRWRASLDAHFARFPLEAFTRAGDARVSGLVSGELSLADLHHDGHAKVALLIADLKVGSVGYGAARIEASAEDRRLDGRVRVDLTDGFAEAHAYARASWGAAIVPTLDPAYTPTLSLTAANFRLAGLLPFFDGTFDELDGRIDGDARVDLDPATRSPRIFGQVALRGGTFKAVAGGGEFHDVSALARLAPDGTIQLEKITASGLTGRLEASAVAHLDGPFLRSAEGVITIPSKSAIPLIGGGVDLGTVAGLIKLSATAPSGRPPNVTVTVPHLRVVLPDSPTTNAVRLAPMDHVLIGARRGRPATFVALPLGPPTAKSNASPPVPSSGRMTIVTDLGDVEVVRGNEIRVDLEGKVIVASAGKTDVKGQIRLRHGGALSIQGRKFTVEEGTVTFGGTDPSNPQVVVKAGWTAADGTVVYANFVGPLRSGKVTLQSEPPLARQEIVQLLLYGAADGQQVQASQATESGAIGTVGTEAAQPINHVLNQLGLGAVTTSIDTTQAANPRPEVEVQIARDVSLQIAVVLGNPPPGVNP